MCSSQTLEFCSWENNKNLTYVAIWMERASKTSQNEKWQILGNLYYMWHLETQHESTQNQMEKSINSVVTRKESKRQKEEGRGFSKQSWIIIWYFDDACGMGKYNLKWYVCLEHKPSCKLILAQLKKKKWDIPQISLLWSPQIRYMEEVI